MLILLAIFSPAEGDQILAAFPAPDFIPVSSDGFDATGSELLVQIDFEPQTGRQLTVVENISCEPITGEFTNLTQGQIITLAHGSAKYRFIANYFGGDGNDLALQWADTKIYGSGGNISGELGGYHLSWESDLVPVDTENALSGKTIVSLGSGEIHTVALCGDGTLACWGEGDYGVLGNNDLTDSMTPVLVDRSGCLNGKTVTTIAVGSIATVVLCSDGTVARWGYNTILSESGYPSNSPVPVAVSTTGALAGKRVSSIAAGMQHFLALCSDGTLVAWGSNSSGQLGTADSINFSLEPVMVDQTGVLAGKTVVSIACGGRHSIAACSDGTVVTWGNNSSGELGDGTNDARSTPGLVDTSGALAGKSVVSVSAGGHYYMNHSLALCSDGTLASWGSNSSGQLGDGSWANRNTPVNITRSGALDGKQVVATSTGMERSYALCSDGTAAAWGMGTSGLAGDHTKNPSNSPISISTELGGDGVAVSDLCNSPAAARGFVMLAFPATNTRLAALHVEAGETIEAAPIQTRRYSVAVPHETTEIVVTPTPEDDNATAMVDETSPEPGTTVQLFGTSTMVRIDVTAPNGINSERYELEVIRANDLHAGYASPSVVPLTTPAYDATGLTLSVTLSCPLKTGAELMVVDNQGIDFIRGEFSNLAQGQTIVLSNGISTYRMFADYYGGDGNDLVLRWSRQTPYFWGRNTPSPTGGSPISSSVPLTFAKAGDLEGKTIEKMDSGTYHGLAVCTSGEVVGWGLDLGGTLQGKDRHIPETLEFGPDLSSKRIINVSVGFWTSMVLCSDGTVFTWGDNYFGQLGGDHGDDGSIPVAINAYGALVGRKVVQLSTREATTIALCSDGALVAWGRGFGRTPTIVGRSGALADRVVKGVSRGLYHSMALCTDGSIATWGYNTSGPDGLITSPTEIRGQLGHGSDYSSSYPVIVNDNGVLAGKTVRQIAAGRFHSIAVTSDGDIATWGYNWLGQIGDQTRDHSTAPILIGSQGSLATKSVVGSAASDRSIALCSDGTISQWGGDDVVTAPEPVDLSNLSSGAEPSTLIVNPEGDHAGFLAALPFDDSKLSELRFQAGTLYPGFDPDRTEYHLAVPFDTESVVVEVQASDPYARIAINGVPTASGGASPPLPTPAGGSELSIVVTSPDNSTSTAYQVTVVRAAPFSAHYTSPDVIPARYPAFDPSGLSPQISLGFTPSAPGDLMLVEITSPGFTSGRFDNLQQGQVITFELNGIPFSYSVDYYGGNGNDIVLRWCDALPCGWGGNQRGEAGTTARTNQLIPEFVRASAALAGKHVTSLATGSTQSLALCSDGTLVGWGYSLPSLSTPSVPIEIAAVGALTGKTVVQIALGESQRFALCSDGTIATWGDDRTIPPLQVDHSGVLAGKNVVSIAAGKAHALALCSDGTLVAWGNNSYGQLGNGSTTTSTTPALVRSNAALSGKTVVAISAGQRHSLALCSDGLLFAWGNNTYGQLGNNTTSAKYEPTPVDQTGALAGKTLTEISAGSLHSLALCSDGTIVSWGLGSYGRLGNNSEATSQTPVLVAIPEEMSGKKAVGIAAAFMSSSALCSDGTLFSWGRNSNGQLGNGTTSQSLIPTATSTEAIGDGEWFLDLSVGSEAAHALATSTASFANSSLADLEIDGVLLTPSFSPSGYSYSGTLQSISNSVSVHPTTAGENSTAEVNGTRISAGNDAISIPLELGSNSIEVMVRSQNSSTSIYRIDLIHVPFETWLLTVFPDPNDRGNTAVSGPMATPAGDGIPNLIKYALGLNPMVPSSHLLPSIGFESGHTRFLFRRSKFATDLDFSIESTDSLESGEWKRIEPVFTSTDMGDYWSIEATVPDTESNSSRRFFRLVVTKP